MYAVGQLDDLREVSAPAKTAGSVLAGERPWRLGRRHAVLPGALRRGSCPCRPDLVPLITVLWVVGMANAVNLIDGLDGLAAGVVAIAAGAVFVFARAPRQRGLDHQRRQHRRGHRRVRRGGLCLGFLPYNFHPAKIFMGDGGALLLGLLMAAATIAIGGSTDAEVRGQTFFFFAPLFIPLVILGVPIVDTACSPSSAGPAARSGLTIADKNHLHHRLMRLGHGQRRAVVILWAWTAILSGVGAGAGVHGRWPTA